MSLECNGEIAVPQYALSLIQLRGIAKLIYNSIKTRDPTAQGQTKANYITLAHTHGYPHKHTRTRAHTRTYATFPVHCSILSTWLVPIHPYLHGDFRGAAMHTV